MIEHNYNIFPILIKRFESFLTHKECDVILNGLTQESFNNYNAFEGNAKTSYRKTNFTLNEIEKYFSIKDKIQFAINQYAIQYGCSNLKIANSWINVQGVNSKLKYHVHPRSIVSGALYLNVDTNSSNLNFLNPNPFLSFIEEFTDNENPTEYSARNVLLTPITGDLIIFPSWLTHGSDQVNQSKERIVLSFNAEYEQ
jgi:uncharacterized protein (TIGR02466 family)